MQIYWELFDWQSFSTLATGVAAVVAATAVGFRQLKIAKIQAEIIARQTELQQLAHRAALFDKRYVVFENTRTYLRVVWQNDLETDETKMLIGSAAIESELLFAPEVKAGLLEIMEKGQQHFVNAFQYGQNPTAENQAKLAESREWLRVRFATISDLFHEMKLSDSI